MNAECQWGEEEIIHDWPQMEKRAYCDQLPQLQTKGPRASIQGKIISTYQSKQSKVISNSLGSILVEVLFIKSVTCHFRFIKLHKMYLNKTCQIQDSSNSGCKDFFLTLKDPLETK